MQNPLVVLLILVLLSVAYGKYNFIVLLTDDQDLLLNSLEPLKNIEKLIANKGTIFKNAVSENCEKNFFYIFNA